MLLTQEMVSLNKQHILVENGPKSLNVRQPTPLDMTLIERAGGIQDGPVLLFAIITTVLNARRIGTSRGLHNNGHGLTAPIK